MKTIENIHVICNNDSLISAVIGDKNIAKEKLEEFKKLYYEKNKHAFDSWENYEIRCYWHIHTLDGLIEESQELNKGKYDECW